MDVFSLASNLTQLYTEAKQSALKNAVRADAPPALSDLHRKFRIQKDRLIAWGLEWTDQSKGPDGNIDESVARAGLTETVTSVLENIKEIFSQVDKINRAVQAQAQPAWPPMRRGDKNILEVVDQSKYPDLISDLTTSVDILYDLSRSRRALATGSHPTFHDKADAKSDTSSLRTVTSRTRGFSQSTRPDVQKPQYFLTPSFASSELTLVNPSFNRPSMSPYSGLPPAIDPTALILPDEEPPPYDKSGTPSATRMVGFLLLDKVTESIRGQLREASSDAIVLIEYANFDPLYRDTGVPPPLQRLERLNEFLEQSSCRPNLKLLGYFEDGAHSRVGLVYDFFGSMQGISSEVGAGPEALAPISLLRLLQTASKAARTSEAAVVHPSLESRFRIALRLTERLREMHAHDFPHGNVNSASITFISKSKGQFVRHNELRHPMLCSFDLFSKYRVERQNSPLALNVYKHPGDQGKNADLASEIRFDMYGLGLLLLEIGLWVPLGDLYKAKYQLEDFKVRLEKIWIPKLAAKCGSAYMRAVQSCLRFSDNVDNDVTIDATYETILTRLRRCCLLDEDESFDVVSADSLLAPQMQSQLPKELRRKSVGQSSFTGQSQPNDQRQSVETARPNVSVSPPPSGLHRLASLQSVTSNFSFPLAGLSPSRTNTSPAVTPGLDSDTPRRLSSSNDLKGLGAIRGSLSSAANSVHEAWRSRRESHHALPFREYRQKVMLIQSHWRRRREQLANSPSPTEAAAQRDLSGQATEKQEEAEPVQAEPEEQIERQRRVKHRMYPVDLPQKILGDWHTDTGFRLARILERAFKDTLDSSSIDLVGIGHDAATARPTILVTCAETARAKAAIKHKFHYDKSIFDLKIRKGRVSLSRAPKHSSGGGKKVTTRRSSGRVCAAQGESDSIIIPENPYWQQRPICGASIGAYVPHAGHLSAVSFGGIIHVDGKPYGMSVHHMLEPDSDDDGGQVDDDDDADVADAAGSDESASAGASISGKSGDVGFRQQDYQTVARSSAPRPVSINPITSRQRSPSAHGGIVDRRRRDRHDLVDDGDDSASSFSLSSLSSDDSSGDDGYASSDFDDDGSEADSLADEQWSVETGYHRETGDTEGFRPDEEQDISITQPALADAVDQRLHAEDLEQDDQDEDHLLEYRFGSLYASSGLRRWHENGLRHEVDWALVELEPPRLQPYNLVLGGRRYCSKSPTFCPNLESPIHRQPSEYSASEDLYPMSVAPFETLPDSSVLCFGRTSGLKSGRIGRAMSFVKIYGRRTFSNSWTVIGDFGIGGDSGAWVIDGTSGRVCGHVLAERNGLTYICPMQILLEDIKRTLEATEVCLPGGAEEAELSGLGLGVDVSSEVSPAMSVKADSLANEVLEELSLESSRSKQSAATSRVKRIRPCSGVLRRGQQVIPG